MYCFPKVENSRRKQSRKQDAKKVLGPIQKDGSLSLRYVKRVSGKRKDHRWEWLMSKFLISEVLTLWNLRTGPMKRLNDSSDVPEARLAIWQETYTSSKKKTKLHATFPRTAEEWVLPAASTKELEEKEFVVDSEASMRMVSKKDLNSAELETMRTSRVRRRWWRPTARCKPEKKPRYMSKNWTYSSKLCFLKKLPQFFPWGKDVRIMGFRTTGSAVKNHISSEMAEGLIALYRTMCHLWFLIYQRVLPQLHLHLLLHHLHHRSRCLMSTDTPKIQYQKEVEVRVKSFGETRCMKPQKPKIKIKMENQKKYKEIYRKNCLVGYRNSGMYINRVWVKSRAGKSKHFQVISWTSNGAASKSGTGFG